MFIRLSAIVLTLFVSAGAYGSSSNCELLLTAPDPVGQIKSDFLHTTNYDVDLDAPLPIKNQCSTSFCHLYAWTAELENPSRIELSSEYLSAFYLRQAVVQALMDGNVSFSGQLGASAQDSINAIRKAGVMPKSAWKGKTDFNREPNMTRLMSSIRNVIARTKTLREAEKDPSKQVAINHEGYMQIDGLLKAFIGEIPLSFEYQGEVHTPLTFADKYFPQLSRPLVRLMVLDEANPNSIGELDGDGLEVTTNMKDMRRTAKALLDQGRPVWLGYQHQDQFVDSKTGIMSLAAFNYPPWAAPLERKLRLQNKMYEGMHAVLLVGYELDPVTGDVRKWKIRNSWGENAGDKGIYHMYDDYFREFAFFLSYLAEDNVPIPGYWEKRPERGFAQ